MRLRHVALTVRDRERAASFYGEHFGLTVRVHDDAHLLILSGEDGSLLALSGGEPPQWTSTNHFGFQAGSPEDVRRARERFRAAGVPETEWQEYGPTRVQVSDPDGYRVEIYAFDW